MHERVVPQGTWEIEVRSARTNRVLRRITKTNTILDGGAGVMAQQLAGSTTHIVRAIAIGTSNQIAVASQTGCQQEKFRKGITSAYPAGRAVTITGVLGTQEGNGETYTEVCLQTQLSAGIAGDVAINRAVHSPISKNDNKTITYRCTITY